MLSLRACHQGVAIQSGSLCGILGRCDGIPKAVAGLPRRDCVPPRDDIEGRWLPRNDKVCGDFAREAAWCAPDAMIIPSMFGRMGKINKADGSAVMKRKGRWGPVRRKGGLVKGKGGSVKEKRGRLDRKGRPVCEGRVGRLRPYGGRLRQTGH